LNLVIGDVAGSAVDPDDVTKVVFIPAFHRTMDLEGCPSQPSSPDWVGAVDVFDMSGSSSSFLSITPPPLPGDTLPCDALAFGHWIALADVDGDDFNDLIVGAPQSDSDEGRVYIFSVMRIF
jgi:hypothetical protein